MIASPWKDRDAFPAGARCAKRRSAVPAVRPSGPLGSVADLRSRATLCGLAAGGETGVARAIEILRQDIDRNLALLGINAVDEPGPGMRFPA